jgi:hypothetical protein
VKSKKAPLTKYKEKKIKLEGFLERQSYWEQNTLFIHMFGLCLSTLFLLFLSFFFLMTAKGSGRGSN